MKILESQHVNEKIIPFVDKTIEYIVNNIKQKVASHEQVRSKVNILEYVENEFVLNVEGYFGDVKELKIHYLVYLFENERECSLILYRNPKLVQICYCNNEDYSIFISSYLVDGKPDKDMFESIAHEMQQLFEYSQGMSKNIDLYNKVANVLQNSKDDFEYNVSLLLYYSFPHEQTAFVQQYYQKLKKSYRFKDFNHSIKNTVLHDFKERIDKIFNNMNTKRFNDILNKFGMSDKQWFRIVDKGYNKLLYRMSNAYYRFVTPLKECTKPNSYLRMKELIAKIEERYKDDKWGYETIYNFGE